MNKHTLLTREEVFKKIGFKNVTKGNNKGSTVILLKKPINKKWIKTMSLTEFKKKVEENLIARIGEQQAKKAMKNYEEDFPLFLEKELSVVATATAIIQGY